MCYFSARWRWDQWPAEKRHLRLSPLVMNHVLVQFGAAFPMAFLFTTDGKQECQEVSGATETPCSGFWDVPPQQWVHLSAQQWYRAPVISSNLIRSCSQHVTTGFDLFFKENVLKDEQCAYWKDGKILNHFFLLFRVTVLNRISAIKVFTTIIQFWN